MKKTALYILVTVLGALVFYFTTNNNKSTIKSELRDFTINDTATITKLFLADKENHSVLLERKNGYWQLNGSYEARADLVNLVLKTLYRMHIKEPVSKASLDQVIKSLAVKSTKLEVYTNNKLNKVIYIGGPTQDSYGTYMILENSSTPFIIEIPGFRGYLSARFSTNLAEWKTQRVFNYAYNEVKSVTFVNHLNEKKSFYLEKNQSTFKIFSYPDMKEKVLADTLAAKTYIAQLKNKNFSKNIDDVPIPWQDSIKNSTPMYTITITDTKGEQKQIKAYNKPGWGRIDAFGDVLANDPDNFFMLLDNQDFVYAQYFVFDALFKELNTFTKN